MRCCQLKRLRAGSSARALYGKRSVVTSPSVPKKPAGVTRIALTSAFIGVVTMMLLVLPTLLLLMVALVHGDIDSKIAMAPIYVAKAPEFLIAYVGEAITGHDVRVGEAYPFVGEAMWGVIVAVIVFVRKLRQVRADS
jgi:hypothetical protein